MPGTSPKSGARGTNAMTLTPFGVRSTLSRNSGRSPSPTACRPAWSATAPPRCGRGSAWPGHGPRAARGEPEAAVADHHPGHAVPARDGAARIPEELAVVVGVQVDEAGRDDAAAGIDDLGASEASTRPMGRSAVLDPDVALNRGVCSPSKTVPPLITMSYVGMLPPSQCQEPGAGVSPNAAPSASVQRPPRSSARESRLEDHQVAALGHPPPGRRVHSTPPRRRRQSAATPRSGRAPIRSAIASASTSAAVA